jgi:uncharacterized protein HemX
MSESDKSGIPEIPLPRRPEKSGGRLWLWLVLAALLGLVGWYAYQWQLRTVDESATREQVLTRLQGEVQALRRQLETQAQKQTELSGSVANLSGIVEGGRSRVQLAAIEQLLLLANDRLLLAHDVDGALRALNLADSRLATLKEPRLHTVREALAQEQAALAALPAADLGGATLALAQIMNSAPHFPLRARAPERFEPQLPDTAPPADGTFSQRVWGAVKTALSAIFTLRRSEGPALRLLAPDEEAMAARILQLKLEGARLALLSGDGAALRDLAGSAADWLRTYYADSDPGVRAALTQLDRVAQLNLNPAPPDISRSLTLLRAQLAVPAL